MRKERVFFSKTKSQKMKEMQRILYRKENQSEETKC